MNPIDYTAMMPQTDFLSSIQGGLNFTNQIRTAQLQRQQQQLQLQRAQQYQADAQAAMQNPTPQAFSALALKYPEHREAFKQSWDTLDTARQQTELRDGADIAATLHSGRPDLAQQKIEDRITAAKNSGQPTAPYEKLLELVKTDPQQAYAHTLGVLAGVPGGDKILANLGTINNAPATEAKTASEADIAGSKAAIERVAAGNATTKTVLDNTKTAADIRKTQIDGQVALLDTQIRQSDSETKRGELQLQRDKLIQEQAKLTQAQGAQAQDGMDSINNSLQTLAEIKKHPALTGFNRPGEITGKIAAWIPGTDRQAFETWVDSLKSQLGYGALMAAKASSPSGASGFGALSDSELKVISQQAGNLDPNSKDFPKQLATIERWLTRAQAKAVANQNLPTKGGAYVATVPGVGVVDEGHINKLMKDHPGSTREQVIQFLQSIGAK